MQNTLSLALQREIMDHFATFGYSLEHAEQIPHILQSTFFSVHAEATVAMEDATWLAVLSFGGRHDALGNVSIPGPQNEALADITLRYYEAKPRLICAQWEVALALQDKVLPEHLWVAWPKTDPVSGRHGYYSTQDVLHDMLYQVAANRFSFNGPMGLVTHRYHLPRVIDYARRLGKTEIAFPPLAELPSDFDPKCYVPWLRDFRGFFLSNAVSFMAYARNEEYCRSAAFFRE